MKEFELEPGEHIVLNERKHWFLFLAQLLPYAILAILPFAIPDLLRLAPPMAGFASFFDYSTLLGHAALGVWLLVVWVSAWGALTRYYLNAWILTNRRLVDITQRGYFRREVSSLLLTRVQDVTIEVNGMLASLLGFGDIAAQTAAEEDEFHMYGIPYPERVRDIILKYVAEKNSPTNLTGV